jgi:hypothetical protein
VAGDLVAFSVGGRRGGPVSVRCLAVFEGFGCAGWWGGPGAGPVFRWRVGCSRCSGGCGRADLVALVREGGRVRCGSFAKVDRLQFLAFVQWEGDAGFSGLVS